MAKRILVIEDEEDFRNLLGEVLEDAGYDVVVSPYIASAVGEAISGKYDLITLDIRMPGIDGLEIAQLVRQQNDTPVVVISGYLTPDATHSLYQLGIHHILPKPTGIARLIETVEEAIAR